MVNKKVRLLRISGAGVIRHSVWLPLSPHDNYWHEWMMPFNSTVRNKTPFGSVVMEKKLELVVDRAEILTLKLWALKNVKSRQGNLEWVMFLL